MQKQKQKQSKLSSSKYSLQPYCGENAVSLENLARESQQGKLWATRDNEAGRLGSDSCQAVFIPFSLTNIYFMELCVPTYTNIISTIKGGTVAQTLCSSPLSTGSGADCVVTLPRAEK